MLTYVRTSEDAVTSRSTQDCIKARRPDELPDAYMRRMRLNELVASTVNLSVNLESILPLGYMHVYTPI